MSFCKFSTEFIAKSYTLIDNLFFTRYLPSTPPKLAMIYLYGLFQCNLQGDTASNSSLENFAESLGYSTDEILEAFSYWEEQGLVRMINSTPLQIQYLPISSASGANKRYSKDKYAQFNTEVQKLINLRMITPSEFAEYYALMEGFSLPDGRKLTPEALLMIIKYCVNNKGANINYRYILTVAQNWAREGIVTPEQISQRLDEYNTTSMAISEILKALGSTKKTSIDEHEFYLKWRNNFEFTDDVICFVAKNLKKSGSSPSFEKLDKKLQKYYELKLLSEQEITEYEKNKDKIYSLAREINRALGLYYDDVTNQVETYINPWLALGFEPETLLQIAQDCYLKTKRTLASMNDTIQSLFNEGIITQQAYDNYTKNQANIKQNITQILQKLSIQRNVTSLDIEFWERWVNSWGFDSEIINLAVDVARERGSNLSYVNTILADWHSQNIHKVEQAKNLLKKNKTATQKAKADDTKLQNRKYTQQEFSSLFDKINEIDL